MDEEGASKHQLLLHQKHYLTTAKTSLTYPFQKLPFFFVHYPLTYLSPFLRLSAVISLKKTKKKKQRKITHNKLQFKMSSWKDKRSDVHWKDVFCGVKTGKEIFTKPTSVTKLTFDKKHARVPDTSLLLWCQQFFTFVRQKVLKEMFWGLEQV